MITATTANLAPLPESGRAAIAALPRDIAVHDAHMATLPCMTTVETGGTPGPSVRFPLTVAAWNLERCLFPADSAAKLAATGARIVLLSEMDKGMARTAQRHPTAEIGAALGLCHAYGVEFIELGLGSDTERAFCTEDHNSHGFHGNAVLAPVIEHPFMIRLDGRRHWFITAGDQPRMGERMAIGGVIPTDAGPIVAVSTHLESVSDPAGRLAQMRGLIDALDSAFPGLPVVIGGDLNTGNHSGGDWRDETLFAHAASRGFTAHGGPDDQPTTRPSLITRWPDRAMKLDWFLTRGLATAQAQIIPSLDATGRPLSDHDLITLRLTGPA